MRIIAVHLFNDYSGSPKVLMQLLKVWTKNEIETHLYTCGGSDGFLSDIPKVNNHFYWYQFAKNPYIRLLFLTTSQFLLALKLLLFLKKSDILYINTVLPFGAGMIGKLKGCKVIYHIHETSMKPLLLKNFLFGMAKWCAAQIVYVSNFLASQEPIDKETTVLYNVLENNFLTTAIENRGQIKKDKIVLMICSLKAYKGVDEFCQLAEMNPDYMFKLVVNANQEAIDEYFKTQVFPKNLGVYPTQKNTHSFYQEASVLLNLSDVNLWVETFGLTVLEGMAYGLPCIVPPVGGVVELIDDSINGFLIDSKNLDSISMQLNKLFNNTDLYENLSKSAIEKTALFNEMYFEKKSLEIVSK